MRAVLQFIVALFVATFASYALASGKLSIEPRYNNETEQTKFIVGLSIYETLFDGVAYNSWTGFGDALFEDADQDTSRWYVTKHQIDLNYDRLTISPGFRFQLVTFDDDDLQMDRVESEVFGKVTYRLW